MYINSQKALVKILILTLLLLGLIAGCNVSLYKENNYQTSRTITALSRDDIVTENLKGYDEFYNNNNIIKNKNKWFDVLYERCEIINIDNEQSLLIISCVVYPKTKEHLKFWVYPELDNSIKDYIDISRTINWADENLVEPNIIDGNDTYTGYAIDWDIELPDDTDYAAIIDIVSSINLHIVVEHDNSIRETEVIELNYQNAE